MTFFRSLVFACTALPDERDRLRAPCSPRSAHSPTLPGWIIRIWRGTYSTRTRGIPPSHGGARCQQRARAPLRAHDVSATPRKVVTKREDDSTALASQVLEQAWTTKRDGSRITLDFFAALTASPSVSPLPTAGRRAVAHRPPRAAHRQGGRGAYCPHEGLDRATENRLRDAEGRWKEQRAVRKGWRGNRVSADRWRNSCSALHGTDQTGAECEPLRYSGDVYGDACRPTTRRASRSYASRSGASALKSPKRSALSWFLVISPPCGCWSRFAPRLIGREGARLEGCKTSHTCALGHRGGLHGRCARRCAAPSSTACGRLSYEGCAPSCGPSSSPPSAARSATLARIARSAIPRPACVSIQHSPFGHYPLLTSPLPPPPSLAILPGTTAAACRAECADIHQG